MEPVAELQELLLLCKSYGISEWVEFDARIVRGLAYYTGIVFEGFSRNMKELRRAICGGGRYDRILEIYGKEAKDNISACGFGFGDCVIMELLEIKKLVPRELSRRMVDDLIIMYDEDLRFKAVEIAMMLRKAGRCCELYLTQRQQGQNRKVKIDAAYSYGDRIGAIRAIFIAPEELKKNQVRVKYLRESHGKSSAASSSKQKNPDFDSSTTATTIVNEENVDIDKLLLLLHDNK